MEALYLHLPYLHQQLKHQGSRAVTLVAKYQQNAQVGLVLLDHVKFSKNPTNT